MVSKLVSLVKNNNCAILKLHSNIVTSNLCRQLLSAVNEIQTMEVDYAIIHSETDFIVDDDITELHKTKLNPNLADLVNAVEQSKVPIAAAIEGLVVGGGIELILGCHYRVALASAKFIANQQKLSLVPRAGASQRLPRLTTMVFALDMLIYGKTIDCSTAYKQGLVDHIIAVSDSDFIDAVISYLNGVINYLDKNNKPSLEFRWCSALKLQKPLTSEQKTQYLLNLPKQKKQRPVVKHIFNLVSKSDTLTFDEGCTLERDLFLKTSNSSEFFANRHLRYAKAKKINIDGSDLNGVLPITKVGIIGADAIGISLALSFLKKNCQVVLVDFEEKKLEYAVNQIIDNLKAFIKAESADKDILKNIKSSLTYATHLTSLNKLPIVIESIAENIEDKIDLINNLNLILSKDCIVATTTAYLDADKIAKSYRDSSLFVAMHFYDNKSIVDLVRCKSTSDNALKAAYKILHFIEKQPVLVKSSACAIGNRIATKLQQMANILLLEGTTVQAIDDALENFGFEQGLFAMADNTGLDVSFMQRRNAGIEAGSDLKNFVEDFLVNLGETGKTVNRGFYEYKNGIKHKVNSSVLSAIKQANIKFKVTQRKHSDSELLMRLLAVIICECSRVLEQKLIDCPSTLDIIFTEGYGFPKDKGGPFYYAQNLGLAEIIKFAKLNSTLCGSEFAASNLLQDMIKAKTSFYGEFGLI